MDEEISEQEWILRIAQAASQGHEGEARELLAQCLQVHPGSGRANYLMAAELAEAGDMEEALVCFAAALVAAPELHEARLQWAMLLLMLGRAQQAADVLEVFEALPAHPAVQAFQRGLRCMALAQSDAALAHLREGLALGHPNAPLVKDMEALVRGVAQFQPGVADDSPSHFLVLEYGSAPGV